jgi:RNA polymerase sigma-70 factor, ECF subfamily
VTEATPGGKLGSASEAAIVVLAMGGDDAAYGELVRRRQSALRNLLRRLSRDASLADDLAQQVFLSAWKSIRSLESPLAFGAWLRKLAVNAWLAHLRKSRLGARVGGRSESWAADTAESRVAGASEAWPAEPAAPNALAERLDLDAALARLAPDVRLCVVLAYSEGMSHREISESAGLPLGTVKSHIARGSARLRELLNAYGEKHVERA